MTTLQAIRPYAMGAAGVRPPAVRESSPVDVPKPRLLDRVRAALRTRHYSRRTEEAYVAWIRRYIFFHGKRHPAEMGAPAVRRTRPLDASFPMRNFAPADSSARDGFLA